MCGFVGAYPPVPLGIAPILHRGPDAHAHTTRGAISMAHARLAILELSPRATQPLPSSDGRMLLAFNGEIYNFRTLNADLYSDTIALADYLARSGPDADLALLDGMYAFAAYFHEIDHLVLARDPAGIKPLYIATSASGEHLAFASELKAFLPLPWFAPKATTDARTQNEFLQFGFATERIIAWTYRGKSLSLPLIPTLLQGVYQLCPGEVLHLSQSGPIGFGFTRIKTAAASDAIALLDQSIRDQSISDVPVGVQLSGGIDSSLVAYHYARQGKPVEGFYVSVKSRDLNEDRWAHHAADVITRHAPFKLHDIALTREELKRVLPNVLWHMDEPAIRHPNALGVYLLCEYVRKQTSIRVLLTGEGADEIFGGYSWHDGVTASDFDRSRRMFDLGGQPEITDRFARWPGTTLEKQVGFDKWFYLPPILARQDRMSMAHGIEARVPFLANSLWSLPAPAVPQKAALKAHARAIFGDEFVTREKCGFGMPWHWLADYQPDIDALDWLLERPEAKSHLQQWALYALGEWSREYLHGGWKTRLASV